MKRLRLVLGLTLAGLMGGVAEAQSLRSDSPLWTYETRPDPDLFPAPFFDDDSFGCSVPLGLGLYRVTYVTDDAEEDETFVRIKNYGAIHCALTFGTAHDREDVDTAFEDFAWLIVLDEIRRPDGTDEHLLALQIGVRAGSRYVLLRRQGAGLSAPLDELDWKCPVRAERRTASIDIWRQDSCIVSSKAELRRMARMAARRPVVATWNLLPREEPPAQDDQGR